MTLLTVFFCKNALNQPIFNVFTPNFQAMLTGRYEKILLTKNCQQSSPWPRLAIETAEGLHHGVPQEDDHHLHGLYHQRGDNIVGGSVNIPPTKRCIFCSPE